MNASLKEKSENLRPTRFFEKQAVTLKWIFFQKLFSLKVLFFYPQLKLVILKK